MTEFLWVEKYRPSTIDECILPDNIKRIFQGYINNNQVPNLLLTGGPGIGKTTVAKALLNQLGLDYFFINASLYRNIDTLRTDIMRYASSMSLGKTRKYVILDESDYLNPTSTQPALRNFMEEFSETTGFILTCNYPNKIIKELRSRCTTVSFDITKNDFTTLGKQYLERLEYILNVEKVKYEKVVLAKVIEKHFPDFRKILNEIQGYSVSGSIDIGILAKPKSADFEQLFAFMRTKDFGGMSDWVIRNSDITNDEYITALFENKNKWTSQQLPELPVILAEYQYKEAFVLNKNINNIAMITEILMRI